MKLTNLKLKNFVFQEVEVSFDPNVTYMIGKNGSGKSTVGLTALWALFQGIAEKSKKALIGERFRFIGDYGSTATIELTMYDEKLDCEIKVFRKITKDTTILTFQAPEGMELGQSWLDELFNLFLINPKAFTRMSAKEQALALGIDTSEYDTELKSLRSDLSTKRNTLKTITESIAMTCPNGVPENLPVVIDIESIRKKKADVEEQNRKAYEAHRKAEDEIRANTLQHNSIQETNRAARIAIEITIAKLKTELAEAEDKLKTIPEPLTLIDVPEYTEIQPADTSVYDTELDTAIANNAEVQKYASVSNLLSQKAEAEKQIADLLTKGKDKAAKRTEYIQKHKLPLPELSINEDGELLFRDRPISPMHFSSGEIVKLIPVIQAALNPDLKFVFLQDFNDLDDENREVIINYLTKQGFQVLIEMVGTEKVTGKHTILLKGGKVVEDYSEENSESIV